MSGKKITHPLAICLSALGVCILLVIFFANPWVEERLKKKLILLEEGPMKLSYGKIDVDLFSGHFSITDVVSTQKIEKGYLKYSFDELNISGLGITNYLFSNNLSFGQINIRQPHVEYIMMPQSHSENMHSSDDTPPVLPHLLIKIMQINEGTFAIKKKVKDSLYALAKGQFTVAIKGIATDSLKQHQYNYFDARSLKIRADNIRYTPDSLYNFFIKAIQYNSDQKNIVLDSIRLQPNYRKYELAHVVNHEIDWLNIYIGSIQIAGFDAGKAMNNAGYHADRISIEGADVLVFRDKRLNFPEKPDTKLLHQLIADAKFKFALDTIQLQNANLEYQEIVKKGAEAGKLTFRSLQACFYHLTNVDSILQQIDSTAIMDAQARVMGKGLLTASFSFPLTGSKAYTVAGKLNEMDMTLFNPMLKPVGFIKIEEGRLIDLNFNFNYNLQQSKGQMYFEYEDLEISTIGKTSNDTTGLGQHIKTFITNTFIVNTQNLKSDKNFRVGEISFQRHEKKSIFNYWWKSLLSGFKSSTGITEAQ